jgi:cAMP-dependent protein kinase regulator
MVLDWRAKGTSALPELLARKQYAQAVELAQSQRDARPEDGRLRLQLADTLIAAGRGREAVPHLSEMADDLAREGFAAKAIALLKRIQKIDPGRADVERRLAAMIAERARTPPPASAAPAPLELGMEELAPEAPTEASAEADASLPPRPMLFPDFSDDELVAVMGGLRLCMFAPGDLVVAEGEPGDSVFLLTAGSVKAWVRDGSGRYVFVRRLGEGEFFGEISVLTGSPRTATVVAAAPCEMLELDRATLDAITADHPRVREVLQRFYEQRAAV